MTFPLKGNAALAVTDGDGVTHVHMLNAPLKLQPVVARNTRRFAVDSLDFSAREVITIGSGRGEYAADLRFEPDPEGLLLVLRHAADGQTLTYYPDLAAGTGYDVWLINDGDVIGVAGDSDRYGFGEYQGRVLLRDASASGQSLAGLFSPWLLRIKAGVVPELATYTRSTAIAKYTDIDGVVRDAGVNIPRIEVTYEQGGPSPDTPWLLYEGTTYTNLNTLDDLDSWSKFLAPTVTTGVDDPEGGTGAFTIEDAVNGDVCQILRTVSFGSDGTKSLIWGVRENTVTQAMPASGHQLQLYDSTAGTARSRLVIDSWSNGEPSVTATFGTFLGQRYIGDGWWALYALATGVLSSNVNNLSIVPAVTAADLGSIDVWRVNATDSTPLWSILDASEAKQQEQFYAPFPHVPQAMCGVIDFRELEVPAFGLENGLSRRILHIGHASNTNPRVFVYRINGASQYQIQLANGSGVQATSTIAPSGLSWGDRVQLFWWLYGDGSVKLAGRRQALGSSTWSAVTTASQSSSIGLASAWSDNLLRLGSVGSSGRGRAMYRDVAVARGIKTTEELMSMVGTS